MYTAFSQVYDELMGDVDYAAWAAFYAKIMDIYGLQGGKVVECACGTGSLTFELYRLGFQMTGVDLSQDMLWQAAQKARKLGIGIPFIKQDMTQLHLHRPMDAVLCTCDGVNYLTKEGQAREFFSAAYQALRPGGGLFFDISSPYKLRKILGNNLLGEDAEHVTYLWQNHYSEKNRMVDLELCIFVRQKDGSYTRIDEVQHQRLYEMDELERELTAAGFENIRFFGDGHLLLPGATEQRWHVAALKRIVAPEDGQE